MRKQIATNLCQKAKDLLIDTEFENDLGNLTKLSTESDAIQVNVATRLPVDQLQVGKLHCKKQKTRGLSKKNT